MKAKCNNLGKN